MLDALKNNFEGYEILRAMCVNKVRSTEMTSMKLTNREQNGQITSRID